VRTVVDWCVASTVYTIAAKRRETRRVRVLPSRLQNVGTGLTTTAVTIRVVLLPIIVRQYIYIYMYIGMSERVDFSTANVDYGNTGV